MPTRTAAVSARIVPLPAAPAPVPGPVDVAALDRWQLQVVFYAAGLRWRTQWKASYEDLAAVVVEQVNRLGLDVVQELARQIKQAVDTCQWDEWESLLPGREARSDSDWFATEFRRQVAIATHPPTAARAAWQHVLDSLTSDDREVA